MRRFSAPLPAAFFALFFVSPANGGDRHSSGNTRAAPYIPTMPTTYTCNVEAIYELKGRTEREAREVTFENKDFAAYGAVYYEIKNAKFNLLNRQGFRLAFTKNQDGSENAELTVRAQLSSQKSHVSTFVTKISPRREGLIVGSATISTSMPSADKATDTHRMRVLTECVELP